MPRRMRKEMLGEAREWQDKHIGAGQKAPRCHQEDEIDRISPVSTHSEKRFRHLQEDSRGRFCDKHIKN